MNKEAFDKITAAQREYLIANGWFLIGDDEWLEPKSNGRARHLSFGHAVNSQLYRDRTYVPPSPPMTHEEKIARWKDMLRKMFADRHTPYDTPRDHRRKCRQVIRWLSRELPVETRVEKARAARAAHAKSHKTLNCSCGRDGAPL